MLLWFIVFWPVAIYFMWRNKKWSFKARSFATAICVAVTLLAGTSVYNAPPSIALSNTYQVNHYKTDQNYILLRGSVSTLHSTELFINGHQVTLNDSGDFNYRLPLAEGNTQIKVVAKSEKGVDTKNFNVHRTTATEFAQRKKAIKKKAKIAKENAYKAKPTCNGTTISSDCKLKGIVYKTYKYHPAVPEQTHTQTVTSHKTIVTGYCTKCADGTYSPSCATGRGACSWHHGVAEWNAPISSEIPVYTKKTIVDALAKKAHYEKILDKQFN